jgi:hypothetical protein
LFGIKGYHITVKEKKKIGQNQLKLMGKEYLNVEKNSTVSDTLGIYKEKCAHCLKDLVQKAVRYVMADDMKRA